jgi:hypothetical protein
MTQDEIIEMAIKAGIPSTNVPSLAFGRVETWLELLEAFAKLVAAKERKEICGTVQQIVPITSWAHELLDAIRARSSSRGEAV